MRRALVLALLLAACGESPDDLFVIGGRTVSTSGEGLDGVPVVVYRLLGGPDHTYLHQTQSSDGGLFGFDLVRVEVQVLNGKQSFYTRFEAQFDGGTRAWSDIVAFPNQLELSDFNDWAPGFSLSDAGAVSFTPVAPETAASCRGNFPPNETVVHALVVWSDAGTYWQQSDHTVHFELVDAGANVPGAVRQVYDRVPLVLPSDVLEDRDVTLKLEAKRFGCVEVSNSRTLGGGEPYEVITRWQTVQEQQVKGTRPPVSRGARCPELGLTVCPLTDGNPTPFPFSSAKNHFRLTLTKKARVKTIVLRNSVVQPELPVVNQLSIKVGSDSLTYFFEPDQVSLDNVWFFDDGTTGITDFKRIDLPRAIGPDGGATDVEIELNRTYLQLGELSLFAAPE